MPVIAGDRALSRARVFARVALGASFLNGVADRFNLYGGRWAGYGSWAGFVKYTGKMNAFMPRATIPFLAVSATVAELVLGLLLVAGLWVRGAAWGSLALLLLFGVAMTISFGIKSPLDYSVFSAAACALLLAVTDDARVTGRPDSRSAGRNR